MCYSTVHTGLESGCTGWTVIICQVLLGFVLLFVRTELSQIETNPKPKAFIGQYCSEKGIISTYFLVWLMLFFGALAGC